MWFKTSILKDLHIWEIFKAPYFSFLFHFFLRLTTNTNNTYLIAVCPKLHNTQTYSFVRTFGKTVAFYILLGGGSVFSTT